LLDQRQGQCSQRKFRGTHRAVSSLLLIVITLAGCSTESCQHPQITFEQAHQSFVQGNLVLAQTQAHKVFLRFSGRNDAKAWQAILLEANSLLWQGNNKAVLEILSPDLPSSLANSELAVLRNVLRGIAYARSSRDFPRAEQALHEAQRLCDAIHCAQGGEIARAWGVVTIEKSDDVKQAEAFFRKSLNIAREQKDRFLEATALLNLGTVDLHRERFDDAIDWSNASLRIAQAIHARQLIEIVSGNLGWAYYKMGDFGNSLSRFQDAAQQAKELGSDIDRTEWLGNAGMIYSATGQPGLAEQQYMQSLSLAKASENEIQTIEANTAMALLSLQQNRLDLAKQFGDEAYRLARGNPNHTLELYALLVRGEISALSYDSDDAEKMFLSVAQDQQGDGWLRWQSHNDLAKLYVQRGRIRDAGEQYKEAQNAVEAARRLIRHEEFKLPFFTNAIHLYDDYIRFLVENGATEEALKEADQSRAQTLAEGLNSQEVLPKVSDPRKIALRTGGSILFYWLGSRQSYLWVITSEHIYLSKLPAASEIDSDVQHYRRALVGPQNVLETENQFGIRLYNTLITPAEKHLPAKSRVSIVADGSLTGLNFETLLASKPTPHYWIDDVTVTNASSLRLLASSSRQAGQEPGKLLLIGNPVVPDPRYPPLSQASSEMQDIEKYFSRGQRQVFAGADATPLAYLTSKPGQFSYIHFVAHGTASQTSPLDSAIVLSKASREEDSFKLHARDIIGQPLQADLVTISTCFGSGTTTYTGEGLVGLSWAFLRAGSHNVIGALWEVSDASTPQLMDQLYSGIKNGSSIEDALRRAKLSLLHSSGPYRKPIYWAPFQLYTGS
jgi:CHAT domain-containing protein